MTLLQKLNGFKTYIAAIGLICLGVYQISIGQIPQGIHSLLTAFTAAGLRGAISAIKS